MMKKMNNQSFTTGLAAEQEFVQLARKKKMNVRLATKRENIEDHIDVHLNDFISVDIKSLKRTYRGGIQQDEWHPIEFIAVTYPATNISNINGEILNPLHPDFSIGSKRKGWLYGKAQYIVFELLYTYLFVKRLQLIDLCCEKINFQKYVNHSNDAKYVMYTRKNRGDLISFVNKQDLCSIATTKWYKRINLES